MFRLTCSESRHSLLYSILILYCSMAGIFRAFFVSLCLLQSTAFRLGPASNFGTKILAHKLHSVAASSNAIGNQLAENKKLGVLLLNLGGPEKNEVNYWSSSFVLWIVNLFFLLGCWRIFIQPLCWPWYY